MQKNPEIVAGIDLGTTKVVCVVAEIKGSEIEIMGMGSHPCRGLERGIVVDIDKTAEAIKEAVTHASQQAGCHISCVYVSVAGPTISRNSTGMVTVRGKEVEKEDVDRVLDAARSVVLPQDYRVIHILPQEFIVNGQDGIKNPIGMCGVRLETKVHLIAASEPNIQNLTKCITRNGLEIEAFVLDPLAGSLAVLQDDEKELGVAYVDVGGSAVNIIIFINESVMYTTMLPIGSAHITKDIAVGLNTPISSAEKLKQKYGHAVCDMVEEDESIEIPMVGGRPEKSIPKKTLSKIIQPRVEQIIDLIHRTLQQSAFLPALASGIVLGGGGSLLPGFAELAQEILQVPTRCGTPTGFGGMNQIVHNPQNATSLGLVKFAAEGSGFKNISPVPVKEGERKSVISVVGEWFKEII